VLGMLIYPFKYLFIKWETKDKNSNDKLWIDIFLPFIGALLSLLLLLCIDVKKIPSFFQTNALNLNNLARGLKKISNRLTQNKSRKIAKEPTFHVKYLDGNHERISPLNIDDLGDATTDMIVKKTWLNQFERSPILEVSNGTHVDIKLIEKLIKVIKYQNDKA